MPRSVESRSSWVIATVTLAVLTISYCAPLVTVVAMKPIAAEFGTSQSAPALAVSLTYIGSGLGGILMGWIFGTRRRSARGDRLWRHVGGWFDCGVVRRIVVALPMQLTARRSAWRGRNVLADDGLRDALVR